MSQSDLQIITMDAPYFTLRNNPLARELFGKVIGARINSYLQDYGEGVFPLGEEDFLSELVLICKKDGETFEPIYSFKITSFETCQKFKISFPLFSMLEKRYGHTAEYHKLENFVKNKMEQGKKLAYLGSRSKSVEVNWTKDMSSLLWGAGVCALVNSCEFFGIEEFVLFGMLNRQAYKYCEQMGMKNILPTKVIVDSLGQSEAYILYKESFSPDFLEIAHRYSAMWENRIHISKDSSQTYQLSHLTHQGKCETHYKSHH